MLTDIAASIGADQPRDQASRQLDEAPSGARCSSRSACSARKGVGRIPAQGRRRRDRAVEFPGQPGDGAARRHLRGGQSRDGQDQRVHARAPPRCSRRSVAQYFAADELAFVSGGPDVGKAFAELPFDHLIFTGATGIGRHILHAAADNLTPVTLELGGKSPVIVGKGADIAQATERVALGKMMNAGQICLAPDYVLVPDEQEQAVVDGLKAAASAMYPTLLANPDYTAIVNDRHHQRLTDWLDDARAKGATIEVVNPAGEDFGAIEQPQDAAPHRPRRDRRHDGDAGGDLRPDPADPPLRRDRRRDRGGEPPRPAARALLFRHRRGRAPPRARPDDLGRRDARRRDLPRRDGGPAVRRRRPVGDGGVSRRTTASGRSATPRRCTGSRGSTWRSWRAQAALRQGDRTNDRAAGR